MAQKYELSTGWKPMARPLWEFKNGGIEGQFMRKLRPSVSSKSYKHRVVFQYHGDPPTAWWAQWEALAAKKYPLGSVKCMDFRSRNLGRKRRRKKNVCCTKCGFMVAERHDGMCSTCVEEQQRVQQLQEGEERKRKEQASRSLEAAVTAMKQLGLENEQLKETCNGLVQRIRELEVGSNRQIRNNTDAMKKAFETERDNTRRSLVSGFDALCSAQINIMSSNNQILAAQKQLDQDVKMLSRCIEEKATIVKEEMKKNSVLFNQLRVDIDISKGVFAKALLTDLYNVGIVNCSSRTRNYGTSSERVGNIAKYNFILKPLIEQILGMKIPIEKSPEMGKLIVYDDLAFRLKQHGFDLHYGRIDILSRRKSLRDIKAKTQLYNLYVLFKQDRKNVGVYESDAGYQFEKNEFYSKLQDCDFLKDIFCALYNYHLKHGLSQTYSSELKFDYSDFYFYKNELIRISFCKEGTMLHLKTYGHTREYEWASPSLITNDH